MPSLIRKYHINYTEIPYKYQYSLYPLYVMLRIIGIFLDAIMNIAGKKSLLKYNVSENVYDVSVSLEMKSALIT